MTIPSCLQCANSFSTQSVDGTHSVTQCLAKNIVVYVGGLSGTDHMARMAERCDEALPAEEVSVHVRQKPMFYRAAEVGAPPAISSDEVSNCRACKHLRYASVGSSSVPMCGATGAVLKDLADDAKGCAFGALGVAPFDSENLEWSKSVTDAEAFFAEASAAVDAVEAEVNAKVAATVSKKRQKLSFEPSTYHTDAPIGEEHKGIVRAWRAVQIGEGEKTQDVLVPIFEPEFFTEAEQLKIPETGSDEHPELYFDGSGIQESFVTECWLNDEPLCFVGEPGTGKTEGGRFVAWLLQAPFTLLSITEETLFEDLVGRSGYSPELGTHFVYGQLSSAIQRPGVEMSDEFNTGQDAIRQAYRSLNTRSSTLYLYGQEDEQKVVVKRHAYNFHLLSLNPVWDARNLGTRELADADVSRLTFKWVEEPPDEVISDIIVATLESEGLTVTREDLTNMLRARKDIKELSRSGALPFSWSIRQDVKVARKLAYYTPSTAYRRCLLDYLRPETASTVLSAVGSHFGFA